MANEGWPDKGRHDEGPPGRALPSLSAPSGVLETRELLKRHQDEEGAPANGAPPLAEAALRKIAKRVVPLCVAVALLNHLDRSNLAYAALPFNRDNKFDAHIYSLGASLFFVSFCVFQVPSNLVMVRVGFRPWLAFLLCAWGFVALSFMFISSAWSFYLLRLLLGVFESGAFPAMWYALSVFYPRKRITKPYAYLMMGVMGANMLGSPLALAFLAMDGVGGLKGWQWLFMLEGIPSILLGILVFILLPGDIESATFLTPEERQALASEVARDHLPGPLADSWQGALSLLRMVFSNKYFYVLFVCSILMSIAASTYTTYTPIIIANMLAGTALSNKATVAAAKGSKSLKPVALAMGPFSLAVVLTYLVAVSSQRRNELFFHIGGCLLLAGVLMALWTPVAQLSIAGAYVIFAVSLASCFASNGPGMALVARLCRGREQVVAQPVSNSFVTIGNIVGPLLVPALMAQLGGFSHVAVMMGVLMSATSLILIALRFWVMYDGGLPDGGVGRLDSGLAPAKDVDRPTGAGLLPPRALAAGGNGADGAGDDVRVLVGGISAPASDMLAARGPLTPRRA